MISFLGALGGTKGPEVCVIKSGRRHSPFCIGDAFDLNSPQPQGTIEF